MTKNTKMLIGIAVVGTAGYLLWKQSQKPKSFANLTARRGVPFDPTQCPSCPQDFVCVQSVSGSGPRRKVRYTCQYNPFVNQNF